MGATPRSSGCTPKRRLPGLGRAGRGDRSATEAGPWTCWSTTRDAVPSVEVSFIQHGYTLCDHLENMSLELIKCCLSMSSLLYLMFCASWYNDPIMSYSFHNVLMVQDGYSQTTCCSWCGINIMFKCFQEPFCENLFFCINPRGS